MTDFSHLDAIQSRLYREQVRLLDASTPHERAFRAQQVNAAKKEEAAEYAFLGITPATLDEIMTDDELLAEIEA